VEKRDRAALIPETPQVLRRIGFRFMTLVLPVLALPGTVPAAPDRPAKGDTSHAQVPQIELHVGIPGLAYIGQPLADLVKKFPAAQVVPFSKQDDAVIVKINGAGISCIAVGEPADLKIASVGFNLDGANEGMSEGSFRTLKGIGKGSTVNDLLDAYGQPVEILGDKPRGALRRDVPLEDASVPKLYQYANGDGSVKTNFLVVNHQVKRVVVNDLAPLDQHIVKASPKK
jgi:hypothetical protein